MMATLSHCVLPVGIKRSQFIGLIEPALKARGLKTSAIRYLSDAFEKWTRDQDYEPGRICGFWHQVKGLAYEMTCTERTINSIELGLVEAGLVLRHPKANGRRDGLRESDGAKVLCKLFGINLAPIIEQASELLAEAEAIRLHRDAMESCRSEIRQINRNIRQMNCDAALDEARSILPEGRSAIVKDLTTLEDIRDALFAVEKTLERDRRLEDFSDQSEGFDVPIVQTKQSKFLYQLDEVTEMYGDYSWRGVINAAYEIARSIGIDDRTWRTACDRRALGPERTALCIILIHRNMCLPSQSGQFPRNPAACFGGLIKKARIGNLNLQGFIYAVSKSQRNLGA